MTQYTVDQYLKKVGEFFGPFGWDTEDLSDTMVIPWTEFYKTMALSITSPILTDKNVIRAKYRMMIDLGFAVPVNDRSAKFNVVKVRSYLEQVKEARA